MNMMVCKSIGVSGNKVYWMRSKCGKYHWCRMAVAIMGTFNMTEKEIATISPFDERFNDNYVQGKGETKEEAYENMEKDMKEMSDMLWVI